MLILKIFKLKKRRLRLMNRWSSFWWLEREREIAEGYYAFWCWNQNELHNHTKFIELSN